MQRAILATSCVLVIAVYVCAAHSGIPLSERMSAPDNYYNLLVQGFRVGQLSVKREVPPALAQLANPYDPSGYASYEKEAGDMSYYRGRLYLYFGATPAVLVFWPYAAVTGQYLQQKDAVAIFCVIGFLASMSLLWALWRRYFAGVSLWVVVAGTLALGLATGMPVMLARCDVYEVPISCGYALTMLALAAMWKALHESRRRLGWLAAASLAYGLAVGARPNLLFGAVILLVPVKQAWRERREIWAPLLAATAPIALIGLGLMLYNALRFDNPFEFGWHYVLAGPRRRLFDVRYLWFNFRIYFLALAGWSGRFPFVHQIAVPPLPAGYDTVENPYGILANIPVVWLALAVPLVWRGRSDQAWSVLRWFVIAVALLFGFCVLPLGLYATASLRFEVDFLPALVLLAVVGIFSLERALAPISGSGLAGQPVWRCVARWCWSFLLVFSVAFNLLACVGQCAEWHNEMGFMLVRQGKVPEAIGHYERALSLEPDFVNAHNNLGLALVQAGRLQEAKGQYEQALRIEPDDAEAHNNLGAALEKLGRTEDAIREYEEALRIEPDFAMANKNLAGALMRTGNIEDAIRRYEQTLQLAPDSAETRRDLGVALQQAGRMADAIKQYQQAARLKPDDDGVFNDWGIALERWARTKSGADADALFTQAAEKYGQALRIRPDGAEALNNWGTALWEQAKTKRGAEAEALSKQALDKYEQALRLKPDYVGARYNLATALLAMGNVQEAAGHLERIVQLNPDFADAHYNLGLALERAGRIQEAIGHYEQAVRIRPDFVQAGKALARARTVQ